MSYKLLVEVLVYLFPKEVVAELAVKLFKRIAAKTEWTDADDELAAVLEKRLKAKK